MGRQVVELDPAVASILSRGEPSPHPSRDGRDASRSPGGRGERKQRPHEVERKQRMMSVTFPAPEWKDAVIEQASRWGVRASDVMTYAVAYLMRAIEDGEIGQPVLARAGFQDRAGEVIDLPWEPG